MKYWDERLFAFFSKIKSLLQFYNRCAFHNIDLGSLVWDV